MLIPNKFSGFHNGVRRCFGGGIGGGLGSAISGGFAQPMTGEDYNRRLQAGETSEAIRDSTKGLFGPGMSDANWGAMVQNAGMTSPTGRPMAGSDQFYQPIYQPQYNNYATTNRLGVSQYGTPMTPGSLVDSAYAGIGRFGAGTGTDQVDPGGRQFWNNALTSGTVSPQNFNQSFNNVVQDYQRQNPNDRYTQYTQNQPGYAGGFTGFSGGFTPQQASFNPYTNRSGFDGFGMGNLSNLLRQAMPQMQSPFQPQQQMQQYNPYQMQSPFSYQQPSYGGYGGGNFIPDAPLPEGMMGTMGGTGFDPMTGRMDLGTAGGSGQYTPAPPRSSGPSQAIVGRSSQMRGTPNVMRRAEGGIASLVDDVE